MAESLVNSILSLFGNLTNSTLGKEIVIGIISLLPILELRGGLLAAGALNLSPFIAYPIAIVANLLPIPFILIFLTPLFNWMKKTKFSGILYQEKRIYLYQPL